MKYLVVGAGGVGGSIAVFMAAGGKGISLIARGAHLDAIRSNGLTLNINGSDKTAAQKILIAPEKIPASDMRSYLAQAHDPEQAPDVVILCTKGYALDDGETIPFLKSIAHSGMILLPILNVFGTGSRLQRELDATGCDVTVTDGCIYIVAEKSAPGVITMSSPLFRVVFGQRDGQITPELEQVKHDLDDCRIHAVLSTNIKRDTMRKFAYISAAAGCGQYYDVKTGAFQRPGEVRDTFTALLGEMAALAEAIGIKFEQDIVAENLNIIDHLTPESDTSMQRDIRAGNPSELDGLVFQVVRLADEYKCECPTYRKISKALGYDC